MRELTMLYMGQVTNNRLSIPVPQIDMVAYARDYLIGLMKNGFSDAASETAASLPLKDLFSSSVQVSTARFWVAKNLVLHFYDQMDNPSRLALMHYAVTSDNKAFFDVLVEAHKTAIDNGNNEMIEKLIAGLYCHPENFQFFKDNLKIENYHDTMEPEYRNGMSISFDKDAFMKAITPCMDRVSLAALKLSQLSPSVEQTEAPHDPLSAFCQNAPNLENPQGFALCLNSARLEGFRKKGV